jgi:hypothetical protein
MSGKGATSIMWYRRKLLLSAKQRKQIGMDSAPPGK